MMTSSRIKNASLGYKADVVKFLELLGANECTITLNNKDGTAEATDSDDGTKVFAAIRKGGRDQPWIMGFYESDRIKWNKEDES
jgi:hypothetical protein